MNKLCFLTSISYFNHYFHILVFLRNRYLLISSRSFSAAREFNFLFRFSYLWHYEVVHRTCAPIFQAQNALVSCSKMLSAFCRRFLVQTSIGQTRIIPFLLTKILELTLSRVTWAPQSYAVQLGYGIPKGFPIVNKVDCWVPCALLKAIMWAFLATKSFAAGSSTYPCHMAWVSKSVPRDVISLSNCCLQWLRSAVDETCDSQGWLLSVPFLRSSGFSGA